jgi:hypothetical protein
MREGKERERRRERDVVFIVCIFVFLRVCGFVVSEGVRREGGRQ